MDLWDWIACGLIVWFCFQSFSCGLRVWHVCPLPYYLSPGCSVHASRTPNRYIWALTPLTVWWVRCRIRGLPCHSHLVECPLIYSVLCDCMCPSALRFPKRNSVVVEKAWCVTLPSFQVKDFSQDFVERKTMSHTGLPHSISGAPWEAVWYCEEQRAARVTLAWVRNLAQTLQLYETEILLWLWASTCEIGFELFVIIF